ncbi:MAG: ExbD/TolR family protein [Mariniblastus sp.]
MPLKTQPDDQSSINLTPMIDIVFLLIIFFMVGTKFSELNDLERDISIKVPAVSGVAALTTAPRKRVINVHADGRIDLDKKMVSLGQLQEDLVAARQQYKKLGVVIRGDESSQYGNVASVFATCQKAGISDLNISVRSVVRR